MAADSATLGPATPVHGAGYRQILKASAVIGSASVLNILVGMLRVKAMALLLGPGGFGLLSLYASIADLARAVASMGLNGSAVRLIAEAEASHDTQRVARATRLVGRVSLGLGLGGALLLALFALPLARLTFGSAQGHAGGVLLLGGVVLFGVLADGQGALLQGRRRIGSLARTSVWSALLGALAAVAIVALLGPSGVALSLVAVAAASALVSGWYCRPLRAAGAAPTDAAEARRDIAALLGMGLAFMASALLTMGTAYAVRLIVLQHEGLTAAGLYQAAWTLGGLYVGLVLQAMGADFYPRLVALAHDDGATNCLVNEQAEMSLLLAAPGVIATLVFAPWVTGLLYSAEFAAAAEVLRWFCLGMFLRVVTWPLGFVIVARGERGWFLAVEIVWTAASVALAWLCVQRLGLAGAGVAFFLSYLLHGAMVWPLARRLSGFGWSAANRRAGSLLMLAVAAVFIAFQALPPLPATAIGLLALLASSGHAAWRLRGLLWPKGAAA